MNGTTSISTATGNGGHFDPQQAAALLDQTTRRTRRALTPAQPWLLAIRAVAVLLTLGVCWLNVRGQHPYHGPTFAVLPFVWGFVVVNFIATVGMRVRATQGISGKSRLRPWEITVLALAWLAVLPVIGGLAAAGASSATAYSLIPLTVPADPRRPGLGGHQRRAGPTGARSASGPGWPWSVPSACSRDRRERGRWTA